MTDDIFSPKLGKIADFDVRVYAVTMQVPFGKVTTYGHIAAALGARSASRMVGYALNSVKGRDEIPCHRVVNRNGELPEKCILQRLPLCAKPLKPKVLNLSAKRST